MKKLLLLIEVEHKLLQPNIMHIDFLSHLVFSQLCSHFIKICTWNIRFLSEKLWGIFWVFWLFEKFDLDLHEHLPSPQDLEMLVIFQYQPVNRAAVNYAWKTRKWSVTHATLCCIQVASSNTISELWKMLLLPSFKKKSLVILSVFFLFRLPKYIKILNILLLHKN